MVSFLDGFRQVRTVSFRSKPASSFRSGWDYSIPMIRNLNNFNDQQSLWGSRPMYIYIYNLYIRILCPVTINCLKSAWFEMIQNLLGHKIPFRLSQSCCNPPKAWDLCNMMVLTQRFFFVDFLHGKPKRRWEASDSNRPRSQKYEAQKRWG